MNRFLSLWLIFLLSSLPSWISAQERFTKNSIQIGVVVNDIEESVDFYVDVIGLQKVGSFDIDAAFGQVSGLTGGKPFSVQVLKLENASNATELKLMSFEGISNTKPDAHISDRVGLRYLTIFVNDMEAALARLEKHDVKTLGETPLSLPDGRRFVLIRDPNGIFIELISPN